MALLAREVVESWYGHTFAFVLVASFVSGFVRGYAGVVCMILFPAKRAL